MARGVFMHMAVECDQGHAVNLSSPSITREGGCDGHGDGEYCYCESEEYSVVFACPACPSVKPAITAKIPQ